MNEGNTTLSYLEDECSDEDGDNSKEAEEDLLKKNILFKSL